VTPVFLRIDAHTSATLKVAFDPADEPDFRGGLSVDLTGREPDGATAFRTQVNLEVKAAPSASTSPTRSALSAGGTPP